MTQLTPNFHSSEFFVSDSYPHLISTWEAVPARVRQNLIQLANRLQVIRDVINKPIKITSGYRGIRLNKAVKGHPNSHHTQGMAADFIVVGMEPKDVQQVLLHWSGGLGRYSTFTHIDIGPKKYW